MQMYEFLNLCEHANMTYILHLCCGLSSCYKTYRMASIMVVLRLINSNILYVNANNKLKIFILNFIAKKNEKSLEYIEQNTIFAIVKFQQHNLRCGHRLLMGVCAGSTQ